MGRGIVVFLAALLGAFYLSLSLQSCHGSDAEDVYVLDLKLDSTKVGKFDSVKVEIFNGQAPGPGDTAKPVQVEIIPTPPGVSDVKLELSGQVKKNFSIIVTGFDSTGVAYRKLHTYEDFAAEDDLPSVLLVSRIEADPLTLSVGETRAPILTLFPSDAGDKRVVLKSDDTDIVQVAGDSLTGMAEGTDSITVASRDGAVSARFQVTVMSNVTKVKALLAKDMRGLVGDTLSPDLTWDPVSASDKGFSLKSLDTSRVEISGIQLVAKALGTIQVEATSDDGGYRDTFEVAVEEPNFHSDVLPITSIKCAPCHAPGSLLLNWQDSLLLIRKSVSALDRLTRADTASGKMPLVTTPSGKLTPRELAVMLRWLNGVAVPLASMTAEDTTVNLGDTLVPVVVFTPPNASDLVYSVSSLDTAIVALRGTKLLAMSIGSTKVTFTSDEGALTKQITVTVDPPVFQKNVLPIVQVKCYPCHAPGLTFNWQDSVSLLSDGVNAIDRLKRPIGDTKHMPINGAPNGELSTIELKVLLAWLESKVVPLKGITVPDDSILLGSNHVPIINWDPTGATNKSYVISSSDTSKVGVLGTDLIGKALGSATVTVHAVEGDFSGTATIKVIPIKVDTLAVLDTAGAIGDTVIPKPNFTPANATDQDFALAIISNNNRVQLGSGNRIIGVALGKDTLEATSTDGAKKTRFVFTVGPVPPQSLAVSDTDGVAPNLVSPRLVWSPATTTNKAFTLSIPDADTAIAQVQGSQILCKSVGIISAVTATSTADPSIHANFKFTVGAVHVADFTLASVTATIGETLTPSITWNPLNATNKNFELSLLAADTAKFQVTGSGTTLLTRHLGTGSITVTSLDSNKTAAWSVNVIRTSFTSNLKGITTLNCGACHKPSNLSIPDWQDSATVVAYAASIKIRINLPTSNPSHMPQGGPMLSSDTLAIIENWLNQN